MGENNQFEGPFEKSFGDTGSNGMGLESVEMTGWTGQGGNPSEQQKLRAREQARYNDLASKAMGRNIPITNEGIVLDAFGGMVGEGSSYPKLNKQTQQSTTGKDI